ncbi:MAG: bifunctional folylpolyglutamate synthase/dihydrofolate synthase [Candidatus Kryptonium sp.]|nr:bifunctional folylpolyglutamate synthase/dihydrofolate synthase [Candidatus Kryptonium sp.]
MKQSQNYIEMINFLYSLQRFGIKLGLQNIERLLKLLQNPERKFISIHVAGTNGKGSTSSFIASILKASGYKVGLYTSPHLVDFTERIRINGIPIPRERVVEYVKILQDEIVNLKATFFEATTAIAFKYFADEKVDFAVVEVGLGGRLDSTNVIKPAVSVITTISYDHMDVLGDTIEKIALEKAGIIKDETPCITGCDDERALNVIKEVAKEKKSKLIIADQISKVNVKSVDENSLKFDLKTEKNFYPDLVAGVSGRFQLKNSQLAILVYELLTDLGLLSFDKKSVYEGLLNVRSFAGLRGRLEIINLSNTSKNPKIIIDVAHNYPAITQLVSELEIFKRKKLLLLFAVMRDKEYEKMIRKLSEITDFAVATQPKIGRALDAKTIYEIFQKHGISSTYIQDSDKAFDFILNKAEEDDLILITGSTYLVGEIIAHIEKRKIECLI